MNKKNYKCYLLSILIVILISAEPSQSSGLACRDIDGNSVDWYVALKLPKKTDGKGNTIPKSLKLVLK